jgi:hypothetical protein
MSKKARSRSASSKPKFDKYWYYRNSVQSPEVDVRFFRKIYKDLRGENPKSFREDFCGTFSISCEWVKLDRNHTAIGVDLDPEPIAYGKENYLSELSEEAQSRVKILNANVLSKTLPKTDIVAALNFSYFIFKTRKQMKDYFANTFSTLLPKGIFILDVFGGSACMEANEEETVHKTFSYFWDQASFNPITNEAVFYIHYKPKGKPKVTKVFSYDWRMWSIPELRDVLDEVGFKKTYVYWEGSTKDGDGDGVFKRRERGDEAESWIAYIVAEK